MISLQLKIKMIKSEIKHLTKNAIMPNEISSLKTILQLLNECDDEIIKIMETMKGEKEQNRIEA